MQLDDLRFELEQYEVGLSRRPHAIVGNKLDVEGAEETLAELRARISLPVFAISAKHRIGIEPLLDHLRKMYDMYVDKESEN